MVWCSIPADIPSSGHQVPPAAVEVLGAAGASAPLVGLAPPPGLPTPSQSAGARLQSRSVFRPQSGWGRCKREASLADRRKGNLGAPL